MKVLGQVVLDRVEVGQRLEARVVKEVLSQVNEALGDEIARALDDAVGALSGGPINNVSIGKCGEGTNGRSYVFTKAP